MLSLSTPTADFLDGVSTWISLTSASTYLGSFSFTTVFNAAIIASAPCLCIKRKSLLYLLSVTCSPLFILCALVIISLSAACLNIFSSFTTLKHSEYIMSFNTFPGPTLGSWSTSPTSISLVPTGTALRSAFIILISTIDISSTMMTSASRGFS